MIQKREPDVCLTVGELIHRLSQVPRYLPIHLDEECLPVIDIERGYLEVQGDDSERWIGYDVEDNGLTTIEGILLRPFKV